MTKRVETKTATVKKPKAATASLEQRNAELVLENARLLDEIRRHTQEITTMAEIGREISASLDLSIVLERIASRAMDLLHARDVILRLLEPDGRLPASVAIGTYAGIYKDWDAHVGQGLSGSVAQSGIAEIINDPENDPRVIDVPGTEQNKTTRAILFAPLLIGDTVIGVLSVWRDKIEVGPFTQSDLDFGLNLARQAAIAIQNAQLFAETQQRFRETEILRAANMELTKSLDLDTILATLLDYLQQLVPYDTGSIFLLEEDGNRLTALAARGYEKWVAKPEKAIGVTFEYKNIPHIQSVIEDQTTYIIPDVTQHPGWVVAETAVHVRNWLAVPLVASDKTIGMYSLDKVQPGFFTSEHKRLAENLAAQAAIAFQNARLFRDQQVAHEQAETLRAAASALGNTLSLQEVFRLILSELRKVVPYDSCSVQQLDGNEMVIVGGHGFPNLDELLGSRFDWRGPDDPAGDVVRRREPVIVADVSARFKHFKDETHGRGRVHGWMGVPLLFGERIIGMLTLDKLDEGFYSTEHANLAQAFAIQAATAIENARLFETEQLARKQAEAQSRQMAALNRVAQAITSTVDLQTILGIAAREMVNILNARSAGVGLLNADRSELQVVAYYSQSDEPSAVGLNISMEGNIATQQVIETSQPILIPDAQSTPLQDEATRAVMRARNTHCILILPLLARGEVIGTIAPDIDQPDRIFSPEDVQLAQNIANQMAGAIENARLFDETQRLLKITEERAQELAVINSVQAALAAELNIQGIYDAVGDKISEIFNKADVSIRIYDPKTNLIHFPYMTESGTHISIESMPLLDKGFAAHVIRTREILVINENFAQEMEKYGAFALPNPLGSTEFEKSAVYVPLVVGDQARGVVDLADMQREHAFSESDVRLLTTLANAMSVALENARLFDETQRLLKITEERAAELAILNSVGEAMAKTLDVKTVTRIVGDKVRDIFGAEVTEILLRDRKSDLIQVPYAFAKDYQEVEPFAMGTGLTSKVILSGKPLVLGTFGQMMELGVLAPTEEDKTESYMAVPIVAGEKMLGVVSVQSYEQNAYNENHVRLLQTLSSNMGVAIENARLFDETQRLLKITEERAAELAIINSVQEGLASKLEMQAIYDLVGNKIRDIFDAQGVAINYYDRSTNYIHTPYYLFRGERITEPGFELGRGLTSHLIQTAQPLVINENAINRYKEFGAVFGESESEDSAKSWLGIPLIIGDQVTGTIQLENYEREHAFSESDVRLLTTLTNAMSVALENARLFDETQRLLKITEERAQELAVINSVQEGLASKLFMQAIYDLIGDKIRDIFEAQTVMIVTYDNKTNLMNYPYIFESGERLTSEPLLLDGTGIMDYVITHKQPIMINTDLLERTRELTGVEAVVVGEGGQMTKSRVDVPMIVGGEVKGGISLQNVDRENAFTDADLRLLQTLTNAMSVALENARLFDETQRLLKVTEERAAELGAISKVSQALIVESELDNTIQLIGSQMREIFSADIVYLALLDSQTNLIHFPYQFGESFEPLAFGEGLTSKIIQTGEPLLINQNLNERRAQIGATLVGREALSYLGVPIKTGKGTIGVISVQSTTQEGIFTDDSLRLLTTIAANAGAALHNAQLFSDALENLRQVEILTNAANAIEQSAYEPAMVESVAARTDALGELARVFAKMADEVRMREQRLKRQLAQMQLDIEEKKLAKAETVAIYIPMDRRQAMAQHVSLPERAHGAALFADVSGFTTLTESLANELGLQRGAEEMIRHLNRVFTVLIDEVHRYSGAVISFSGDAITCWFDDLDLNGNPRADASVERAAACAFAMQKGMTQFAAISTPNGKTIGLSIKVALAVGPTRRMAVGDGSTHQIDVLAGATLTALANAEHESERGEIVLAAANLTSVEETFNVSAWREEKQFAVLSGLKNEVAPSPWAEIGADAIIKSRLRSWMHPTVFEKVRAGQSEMLSELRPATALFMKFGGLDYDNDPQADKKLNAFLQWVEGVIAPHNGAIIQFTVGDKGSYIYIVFGAPIAHRDDAAQAVFTALELASPPESLSYMTDLFIGLASGQMRVGAYGGAGHRTYGAIGDRTNLAARLMVAASKSSAEIPAGQRAVILCNDSVYEATQAQVEFESMPRINVKGKTEAIAVYRPLRKLSEIHSDASFEQTQRIDDLPAGEQLTLKVASVIGQMFTFESLSAIYPEKHTNAALQKQLQTLSDLGLIHKRPNEASSYNFKDQQTHEAAYSLMLFAQRRQLHRAVAGLLEQTIFSVPPYAEIAHHWRSANEIPKAIEYLEKAGVHARQMGDFEQATRFFNESLALNK